MKHHEFFTMLSITLVLLIAALVTPALLGHHSDQGMMASMVDIFGR